jgi:hypothetical protein
MVPDIDCEGAKAIHSASLKGKKIKNNESYKKLNSQLIMFKMSKVYRKSKR